MKPHGTRITKTHTHTHIHDSNCKSVDKKCGIDCCFVDLLFTIYSQINFYFIFIFLCHGKNNSPKDQQENVNQIRYHTYCIYFPFLIRCWVHIYSNNNINHVLVIAYLFPFLRSYREQRASHNISQR